MCHTTQWVSILAIASVAGGASAGAIGVELLADPGFEQGSGSSLDAGNGAVWGTFGAAGVNAFFGDNGHGSLFADGNGNFGGLFQTGISNMDGVVYTFTLSDVRIESNFNASFRFGLEFYAADDSTQLGATFATIDTNDPNDGLVTGDGLSFSVDIAALDGAAFVRPIIIFDNAAPIGSGQQNAFVFEASLVAAPAPASALGLLALAGVSRRRR